MGRGSAFGGAPSIDEKRHLLKLSIDFLSVKEMKISAQISVSYSLRLQSTSSHQFKSAPATPVNQGATETKLQNSFASYDFQASKTEIAEIIGSTQLIARINHAPQNQEIGFVVVEFRDLLSAPLKTTPQASVRVCDQYLPIRDSQGQSKGLIRCILYLQDLGEVQNSQPPKPSFTHQQTANPTFTRTGENRNPNDGGSTEYQAAYQLELWKRSEETKFKAWLKQREIERIEEITSQWKTKESDREKAFIDSLNKVAALETKVRAKALDLQKREERIVQLEEELKQKIAEVSRQLTLKEEEIMNVKKRFKEERTTLEMDKKKLQAATDELKGRAEHAEAKLLAFKRDIDESPLSVLRGELAQKNLELIESDTRAKQAQEDRDDYKRKFELLKKDMVTLKKTLDREQKDTLQRQAEELDKLKNDIRNKQLQEEERREMNSLKQQLQNLTSKLAESHKMQEQLSSVPKPETINDRITNPFKNNQAGYNVSAGIISGPQQNVFLDNFAKGKESPMKSGARSGFTGGNEIERLMQERQDLIQSGNYTTNDPLIQELDRSIRAAQLRQLQ
ncbi:hypothetical protein FGO68_gene15387 [Halteria grandinella]|uniref:C2 NT-type domain-containing protein n=1 Tax=Halteria grandinella TaxID=5974 RepID=A0A8J8NZP4_HALGN|nr:hypothetical protein FGO68_gene15387 [Halteria grandinella]